MCSVGSIPLLTPITIIVPMDLVFRATRVLCNTSPARAAATECRVADGFPYFWWKIPYESSPLRTPYVQNPTHSYDKDMKLAHELILFLVVCFVDGKNRLKVVG